MLRKAYREYYSGDSSLMKDKYIFFELPDVENVVIDGDVIDSKITFVDNLDFSKIVEDGYLYLFIFSYAGFKGWQKLFFDIVSLQAQTKIAFENAYIYAALKIKIDNNDEEILKQKLIANIEPSINSYFDGINRNKNTQKVYAIGGNNTIYNPLFVNGAILGNSNKLEVNTLHYKKNDELYYFFQGILFNRNIVQISEIKKGGKDLFFDSDNICYLSNSIDENCIFNNCLIKDPVLDVIDPVYKQPAIGSLAIRTKIKTPTYNGDNYIIVEDTKYIMLGHYIGFMTEKNGFSYRKVIGVSEDIVYLDKPLKNGDDTFVGGMVKSDLPEELEEFSTVLMKTSKIYNRRFYLKDDPTINLYLRDVLIGDFSSVVTYYDAISNLLLTSDISETEIPEGTEVICPAYKFKDSVTFTYKETLPVIYIGQKIIVDENELTINGFNKEDNSITTVEGAILDGKEITTIFDYSLLTSNLSSELLDIIEFKKYNNYLITSTEVTLNDMITVGDKTINVTKITKIEDNYYVFLEQSMLPKYLDGYIIDGNIITERQKDINIDQYLEELAQLKESYENNN